MELALTYLRRSDVVIEPRVRWPVGVPGVSGAINQDLRLQPGRALSVYGDGGWGSLVRRGKYQGHRYPDELVDAAAALIERWRPEPWPEWLTYVPSSSAAELVPDFAARLADAMRLPLLDVVARVRRGPPQKEMENSAQQFRNISGAFAVRGTVPKTAPRCPCGSSERAMTPWPRPLVESLSNDFGVTSCSVTTSGAYDLMSSICSSVTVCHPLMFQSTTVTRMTKSFGTPARVRRTNGTARAGYCLGAS